MTSPPGPSAAKPFRLPAAPPEALVAWPEDFGTRFVVTVDTEEEFDWAAPLRRDARSVAAVEGIPAGHARFAARGVPLCYLVDHPIATDRRAMDILGEALGDGRSTVGTQLHPWVNPPFDEAVSPANSFAGNLPRALEAAKIATLTDAITRAIGVAPRIYRSGRYGIGPNTLELLALHGYRIDSSVRARYDYSDQDGPDFTQVGNAAYRTGPDGRLMELPLTTVYTGQLRRRGATLYPAIGRVPRARGLAARLGLLSRVALTPEDMPVADALEAVRIALGEGERLLSFSFHSPSLVPGHTPYVRNARDLHRFHAWWDRVLNLLEARDVRPIGIDAIIAAADDAESLASGRRAPLPR